MIDDRAADPYRWAKQLAGDGVAKAQIHSQLIDGGVDRELAEIIVASVARRTMVLSKVVFGLVLVGAAAAFEAAFLLRLLWTGEGRLFPASFAALAMYGVFLVFDGVRGR